MKKNFFRKVAFGLSPNEKIKREVFWEQNIKNYSENLFKA